MARVVNVASVGWKVGMAMESLGILDFWFLDLSSRG